MKILQLISSKGRVEAEFLFDSSLPVGECKLLRPVTMQVAATRIVETKREVENGERIQSTQD